MRDPVAATRWSAWRQEVFGDPYLVWHEGADFGELITLARADSTAVAEMLAVGLTVEDPLAADSIRALNDSGITLPKVEALLRDVVVTPADPAFLLAVAHALYASTGEDVWVGTTIGILAAAPFWSTRMDAARALAHFRPTTAVVSALAAAMSDPEYLVRYHAANTLIALAFPSGDRPEFPSGLQSDAGPEVWVDAADALTSICVQALREHRRDS
ncbi:HEAT repeat domain-containing protein [Nocardia sp. NBC_00511]|uniref:HEAT repeat domain-containing protein n=1 Tax=Nocardia sp. NBC_00511 TaxID=2903591 RepID=UPI0030E48D1E